MFVLVPFFAWLVALVRRRSGRRFPAHFVFALEIHAAGFGALAISKAFAAFSPPGLARGLEILAELYLLAYIFRALRTVYGGTRLQAARDTGIVAVVYGIALIVATGAVVGVTMFGRRWLAGLGS